MAPGRRLNIGEALVALPQARIRISANLGGGVQKGGYHMAERREDESRSEEARQIEGLPVVRAQVGGIDLGSQRHWVCAPGLGGRGREIADFGATTPELQRMLEWLKVRQAESVAMESTGVYWIAPQEVLEAGGLEVLLVDTRQGQPGGGGRGLGAADAEKLGPDECAGASRRLGSGRSNGAGHRARHRRRGARCPEVGPITRPALPEERSGDCRTVERALAGGSLVQLAAESEDV